MGTKQRRRKLEREFESESEPWPEESELYDVGEEPIIAAGFTPGGFPYGSTLSEFRESMTILDRRRPWARAKSAIVRAVESFGLSAPEVGRVRKIRRGLSRSAFAAEVHTATEIQPRNLVALVPHKNARARGMKIVEREAQILRFLARQKLGFRVPDFALAMPDSDEAILVCEHVTGLPADLRVGRVQALVPWKLVGEIAANVHAIPVGELAWLGGYATRREHGERLVQELANLERAHDCEAEDALGWLRKHLPPDEPARLVHGDLRGKNLLFDPDRPTVVLDWERAFLGDPAHDLAIVTRGSHRPFQVPGGLTKLLKAYAEHSDVALSESEVRFHEIALHLRWFAEALPGTRTHEPTKTFRAKLRNLLWAV